MNTRNETKKYNPNLISPFRRLGAFLADAIIFLVTSIMLFSLAVVPIISSLPSYKSNSVTQDENYNIVLKLTEDARLVKTDGEGNETDYQTYANDILKHFIADSLLDDENKFNDIFYHFYLETIPTLHFKEAISYSISWVNENVYRSESEDNILFDKKDNDINKPLILKEDAKNYLTQYFDEDINSKSEEYYNYAMKLFSEERNKASEVLLTSNEYNEASHLFINSANKLYNLVAVSSLITYTILFFLYYFIVPLCLKKGQTFAKKMLHIGVFFKDNKMVTPGRLFARWLLQYIFYLFFALLIPLFQIGPGIIRMPLFFIGDKPFYFIPVALVSFILCIISYIYLSISSEKTALHDKLSRLLVLKEDPVYFDPEEQNIVNKGDEQ